MGGRASGRAGARSLVVVFVVSAALIGGLLTLLGGGAAPRAEPARRSALVSPAAPAAPPRPRVDRFDAPRAMALIRRQVAFGQRPAGSPQLLRLARVLRPLLPAGRFEPLPGAAGRRGVGLRNVVGVLPGRLPALVIGAHYDSESHPKGFVGANDSAAGTAALVEVARSLAHLRRPAGARELRFVLFDGEEEPKAADNVDFLRFALRGSKAYVAAHRSEVRALVLLDYIANRGLRLPHEASSDRSLWGQLRGAAAAVGVGSLFPPSDEVLIYDDHTPFLQAGVPAIDLIDFSYRYADGLQDTVDKLDVRALDAVGESVVELVRRLDRSGY